jgi:hypothetical protein
MATLPTKALEGRSSSLLILLLSCKIKRTRFIEPQLTGKEKNQHFISSIQSLFIKVILNNRKMYQHLIKEGVKQKSDRFGNVNVCANNVLIK